LGVAEDQPIENRMVSAAIESAQAKIEGFNFDARKHILEYDDVMNFQRNKIYKWRREILTAGRENILGIINGIFTKENKDFGIFIQKQKEVQNEDEFFHVQRMLLLRVIDMLWVEHLETMEYMRSSVNLRAYGHRDPLVEYKNEASSLFKGLESSIRAYYIQLALGVSTAPASGVSEIAPQEIHFTPITSTTTPRVVATKPDFVVDGVQRPMLHKGLGRNDPCPCGSGKKYKKCHGG